MSKNSIAILYVAGVFVIALLMVTHHAKSAEPAPKEHGWNMEHCMPKMEAHCRMNETMTQMEKEMKEHRAVQHCMPNMTAHCQAIADLDYMQSRMADMKINMQHCMETNEKDCPMPEMTGEMKAMRDRMDALNKEMQEKMLPKDEKGQIDIQHERAESHGSGMSDEFHQHERERNIP